MHIYYRFYYNDFIINWLIILRALIIFENYVNMFNTSN